MGYMIKICPGLAHHLTILRQIVVGNGAAGCRNCFAVSDSCQIVGVADTWTILGAAGVLDLRHLEKKISGLESAKSTVYSHSYGLHNIFFRFQPEL